MMRLFVPIVLLFVPLLAEADVERIAPAVDPPTLEELFPGRLERIAPPETSQEREAVWIAVAVPFLAELAEALCEGTGIEVRALLPDVHVPMTSLPRVLADRESEWEDAATDVAACVTIRGAWPADPLYPLLRGQNIRVVEIDATRPLDGSGSGIALLGQGLGQDGPPPHVWLHPGNALRMAEIVAADLAQLAPEDASRIRANLAAWREPIVTLQNEYIRKFASAEFIEVATFTNSLDYLLAGFDLPVVASIEDPESASLEDLVGIPTAIFDRAPSDAISQPLTEIGITPVVLDPLWHWPAFEGRESANYLDGMRINLSTIAQSLVAEVSD